MIKILYFISTLSLSDGVTTFVLNLIRNLDLNEFKVSILCSDIRTSIDYQNELKNLGVDLHFVKSPGKDGFVPFLRDLKRFFAINHNFDIIHCNTTSSGAFVLREAKKYKIKVRILHAHATRNAESFLKNFRNSILKYFALKNTTHRFACSKMAGEYLFGKNSFYLVRNAVDYSHFKYNYDFRQELRNKYFLDKGKIVIGFVGRFVEQKNPEFAVDLMDFLNDENFVMFILGAGPKYEKIQEKIEKSRSKNRIYLVGEVNDTYKRYSFFDFVIMPSLYEGLPLVGIECQIAGCKLICSENITPETKISDNVYFIGLNNIQEWIRILKSTQNEYRTVTLKNDYDIHYEAKRVEQLYKRITNK